MHKKLSSLSKADLIQLIDILRKDVPFVDRQIGRALNELEYEKYLKRIAAANAISAESSAKMEKTLELLAPYDGKRICDIPDDILSAAAALQKEAWALDRKWSKLMKIEGKI